MNYYTDFQYNFGTIATGTFQDLTGTTWYVSIQDPNETEPGDLINLTFGPEPFVSECNGNEDQLNCLCGSTATLSLICKPGEEHNIERIRPTEINNRRIIVSRGTTLVWQGFIKPEEYTQPFDAAPYQIQLTCVDAIETLKQMPMPPYESLFGLSDYPNNLGKCLLAAFDCLGLKIQNFYVNVDKYVSFDNKLKYVNNTPISWIDQSCHPSFFYDFSVYPPLPKMISEVVEAIVYPYGHICVLGKDVYIMTAADGHDTLYKIVKRSDGECYLVKTDSDVVPITDFDEIEFCGTNSTKTKLLAPKKVTYKRGLKGEPMLFELKKEMIDPSFEAHVTMYETFQENLKNIHVCHVPNDKVNGVDVKAEGTFDIFAQRVSVTKFHPNLELYTTELVDELALWVRGMSSRVSYSFDINRRAMTTEGYNSLRFSFEIIPHNGGPVRAYGSDVGLRIKCGNKYLSVRDESGGNKVYEWVDTPIYMYGDRMARDNEVVFSLFNLPPSAMPQKLEVSFSITLDPSRNLMYVIKPKLEYVEWPKYEVDPQGDVTNAVRLLKDTNNYNERVVQCDGGGEDITVEFKTLAGNDYEAMLGTSEAPRCSICDATNMIDTGRRTMLDIDACRIADVPLALAYQYRRIYQGSTLFLPAAVGINARDCTMKLKLVSSNI